MSGLRQVVFKHAHTVDYVRLKTNSLKSKLESAFPFTEISVPFFFLHNMTVCVGYSVLNLKEAY